MTVPGTQQANTLKGTPYDTVVPFLGTTLPAYVGSRFDQLRVASYDLYDAIYRNVSGTFALIARGTENNPIYIPSGRTIVESCNRYLAVGFDYTVSGGSSQETRDAVKLALDRLFRYNKFWSKFMTQKRYGLIRGDALWHIVADDRIDAPEKRITMYELDPRTYFPITALYNVDQVIGCHIIQRMTDPVNKSRKLVKRQTYQFNDNGTVQSSMDYFLDTAWDDRVNPETLEPYQRDVRPVAGSYSRGIYEPGTDTLLLDAEGFPLTQDIRGEAPFSTTLDARITSLPVYHIRNTRAPNDPFGVSEMSGLERVIAAVNQAITDEELTLALDGLGLYATNSGPPQDEAGNDTNWVLGPGRVVELEEGSEFKRVSGVASVAPVQQHLDWMVKAMRENSATANIAIGVVDSHTALSGVALALQLSPLLAKNKEKETEMIDEYDHMLNDIVGCWMPVYGVLEAEPEADLVVTPFVGDPMPVDRLAVINEVVELVSMNIITILEAQQLLEDKLGYDFKMSTLDDLKKQLEVTQQSSTDTFGARLAAEANTASDT